MKYLEFEQFLPIPIEQAWHFFSSPDNLNRITPPHLKFRVLDKLPDEMYKGLYKNEKAILFDIKGVVTRQENLIYFKL